jgi:ankyrin repeat protein
MTALMLAAQQGHKEIMDVLIAANANLECAAGDGMTTLMHAAKAGHTAIVSALIDANAGCEQNAQGWLDGTDACRQKWTS